MKFITCPGCTRTEVIPDNKHRPNDWGQCAGKTWCPKCCIREVWVLPGKERKSYVQRLGELEDQMKVLTEGAS